MNVTCAGFRAEKSYTCAHSRRGMSTVWCSTTYDPAAPTHANRLGRAEGVSLPAVRKRLRGGRSQLRAPDCARRRRASEYRLKLDWRRAPHRSPNSPMELGSAEASCPMADSLRRILAALTRPLVPATANAVIVSRARQDTIGAHFKNGSRVARSSSHVETRYSLEREYRTVTL
jgi:hypothetical protein